MKTLSILIIAICSLLGTQTLAQDCELFVPMDVGTVWEITNYTAKGKADGTSKYELIDKVISGNDVTFTIKVEAFDKKGKLLFSQDYEAFCKDGFFEFDMSYMLERMMTDEYKDLEIDITMDVEDYKMPKFSDPVGTELEDSKLTMNMNMGGMNMKTELEYTERKLTAKENISTPAGTYDCILIEQTVSTKISIMNTSFYNKDWFSEGVGMVRTETYNKKGKLVSYSELTSFSQ